MNKKKQIPLIERWAIDGSVKFYDERPKKPADTARKHIDIIEERKRPRRGRAQN